MASKLPYTVISGTLPKIFEKIQQARRPERFTQDFLGTKLNFPGGNRQAVIPLLKRMGFLESDGSPTSLYDQFRNHTTQGAAIAEGMRRAYSELYERNEYVHDVSKENLTGLVTEITGASKDDRTTKAIVSTFWALKEMADFDAEAVDAENGINAEEEVSSFSEAPGPVPEPMQRAHQPLEIHSSTGKVGFNVAYTINLNLPETTDPEVFNAIFKSLKENLLQD